MEAKPISFEIKVGIFVFLGILLMFIIVFSIGEFYILKPIYRIKVLFGFANGIEVGAPVRLAGVSVGEIENIGVYYDEAARRTRVFLMAKLKKEARVERDAACMINTLGLLGEKYLEITPGTEGAGFVQDQGEIMGQDPVPTEELTKAMKELSDSARAATESAETILRRLEKGEGTVGKLLVEEEVYNDLRDFVKDIKAHPWKLLIKGREKTIDGKEAGKSPRRGVNFSR